MNYASLAMVTANTIDWVHTWIILPIIIVDVMVAIFASSRRTKGAALGIFLTMLATQLGTQDCLVSMFVQWLRHFQDPLVYQNGVSWTYVYMHYLLPYPNLHWVYSAVSAFLAIVAFAVAFIPTLPKIHLQIQESAQA